MRFLLCLSCVSCVVGVDPDVTPISLFGESFGCQNCCNNGDCTRGFKNMMPGQCCQAGANPSCCPLWFNGMAYHCQYTGNGYGCAPGAPQNPPPVYQPPPAPPVYQPPPAPAPAVAPAPPPAETVCNKETGGSCRVFSCSSSRGPTDCVGGLFSGASCKCQAGYCAFNGKCIKTKGCDTSTPGTCSVFKCSSKRGAVDCVSGKCVCQPGACSVDGVCTQACEKATGVSCHIFGCKGNAQCQNGACVCGVNDCNWGGTCLSGLDHTAMWLSLASNMTMKEAAITSVPAQSIGGFGDIMHTYLDKLPDHDDPVLLTLVSAVAFGSIVGSIVVRSRRQSASVASEPLLGGAA